MRKKYAHCFARNDPNFEWSENYAVVVTHKAFLLLNEWLILNLNFWRRWARKSGKRVEKWKEKLRDYWWQLKIRHSTIETTKWRFWRKKEMGYFECVERGIRLWCTFSASVRSWHNWCTRNVTAGLPPSFTGSCVNIMWFHRVIPTHNKLPLSARNFTSSHVTHLSLLSYQSITRYSNW